MTASAVAPLVERPDATPSPNPRGRWRRRRTTSLTPVAGLGLGITMLWFSLLVLIPLIAIVVQASSGGWQAYWDALTSPQTAAALRLSYPGKNKIMEQIRLSSWDHVTGNPGRPTRSVAIANDSGNVILAS